jgi:hypothetical protein
MNFQKVLSWVNTILVVAILVSLIVLVASIDQSPAHEVIPQGSVVGITMTEGTEIMVTLGDFSPSIALSECNIVATSPAGVMCQARVTAGTLEYPQSSAFNGLSNIIVSSTGIIREGMNITLENDDDLEIGSWSFEMVQRSSGETVLEKTLMVPDMANPPTGSFSNPKSVSSSEERLVISLVTPATELSFVQLGIRSPDGTSHHFNLTTGAPNGFRFNNTTMVEMFDVGGDGILSTNDYVIIRSTGQLQEGIWSASLVYVFTNTEIDRTAFYIGTI